ncbi:hypothetical protein ABGF48_01760 [Helcococcus bovis]|uniref:hypothetical protein n=1 Tax=Helcococcus bovis TaxID=3153252 RepID=UPI0038BCB94A
MEKSIYVVYGNLFENSNIKKLVYLAKNNNIDSLIKINNYYILVISKDNKNIKILDLSKNDNYEDVNLDSENIIENEDLIKKIETSPLSFI